MSKDKKLMKPHRRQMKVQKPQPAAAADKSLSEQARASFGERQRMQVESDELLRELREHSGTTPALSSGDVDAAWDEANVSGEEAVGGTVPTPDQDNVDELGEAVGLTYEDDEPLGADDKLRKRDKNRWELRPASQDAQRRAANLPWREADDEAAVLDEYLEADQV